MSHRAAAVARYEADGGDFEALRERGHQIREESVRRMPELLLEFERNARAAGSVVLWAKDGSSARRIMQAIARHHGVRLAVKSKSMASEEAEINQALQEAGVEAAETDLGEFIIQMADEKPSHILAPAVHKSRDEVAALMRQRVGADVSNDIPALTLAARGHLREKFLRADMGISGANFLVAETGSSIIVTNEGNGRMSLSLPRVHVTLAGIDKIVPRWGDIPDLLGLLTRSATGQRLSNYVSACTGTASDGGAPRHEYVILMDNGRARMRHGECRDMLRCIRCGACMNHCPVYQTIGGHAYDSAYMGPMGQVLTPALDGLQGDPNLPHAATMCGACAVACPVKIPLPDLMRRMRARQASNRMRPFKERALMRLWVFFARRPRLYAAVASALCLLLYIAGGKNGQIRRLPGADGWFAYRNLSAPASPRTFRALFSKRRSRL